MAVGMAVTTPLLQSESISSAGSLSGRPGEELTPSQPYPAFVRAMQGVLAAIPVAEADPDRPVYHFRPPANWTNDPNAPFYYRGWHHLFYQFNPFEPRFGNQHWGHARSRDLVNWEHLPIAIWPSTELGEFAVFSGGSAFAADGRPRLIYTSIGRFDTERRREPEQWMMLPKDEELFAWETYPKNPVLSQAANRFGPISQWRDPFLFRKDNSTYMVCGGGSSKGRAQVQLYRATKDDLTAWVHLGPIFQSLDRDIRNFECPNLFSLDGRWVMNVSPNRACEYWVGDLDIAAMKFVPSAHGILDPGDAYASNISVDYKGRTLLWLWGRTNTRSEKGWGSVLTLPRILSIGSDGFIRQQPIPEIEMLREPTLTFPAQILDKPSPIQGADVDCAEIEATFTGNGTFGLELRRSADGKPGIVVSVQTGFGGAYLTVGNSRTFIGAADRYNLRVFLDKRCIEVFANDGVNAVYNWVDVATTAKGVAVFGQIATIPTFPGRKPPAYFSSFPAPLPPRLESLKIWPMKNASFSLEHFHV
jgi:sucrose-6-phosphate hydrolase SacC (GH32 family)